MCWVVGGEWSVIDSPNVILWLLSGNTNFTLSWYFLFYWCWCGMDCVGVSSSSTLATWCGFWVPMHHHKGELLLFHIKTFFMVVGPWIDLPSWLFLNGWMEDILSSRSQLNKAMKKTITWLKEHTMHVTLSPLTLVWLVNQSTCKDLENEIDVTLSLHPFSRNSTISK